MMIGVLGGSSHLLWKRELVAFVIRRSVSIMYVRSVVV